MVGKLQSLFIITVSINSLKNYVRNKLEFSHLVFAVLQRNCESGKHQFVKREYMHIIVFAFHQSVPYR